MKEIRVKNNDVYMILNKIKTSGIEVNLLDKKILNKINKYINIKDNKIELKDSFKIYKM